MNHQKIEGPTLSRTQAKQQISSACLNLARKMPNNWNDWDVEKTRQFKDVLHEAEHPRSLDRALFSAHKVADFYGVPASAIIPEGVNK